MKLRWIAESGVEPARALATGAVLASRVSEGDAPPAILYGAGLTGDALVLGRWQRAKDALRADAVDPNDTPVLRRTTGGPAAVAGEGIVYVALCLRHASAFMDCPVDRILNRNVRGLLGGLARGGAHAHYFGRQWLSVDRRPAALVGWNRDASGAVLVEVFLSHHRAFVPPADVDGYPKPSEPPFRGHEPITLADVWEDAREPEDLVRMLAEGHPDRYRGELVVERRSLDDAERTRAQEDAAGFAADLDDGDGLSWSAPKEVPIGFLGAGVRVVDGTIAAVEVAGDFYQDAEAPRVLAEHLVGSAPDAETLVAAVNGTWDGTHRVIEGVKELESILAALMEAAEA